jgi:hypothetical protein
MSSSREVRLMPNFKLETDRRSPGEWLINIARVTKSGHLEIFAKKASPQLQG